MGNLYAILIVVVFLFLLTLCSVGGVWLWRIRSM